MRAPAIAVACLLASGSFADEPVVGKTVSQAVELLRLELDRGSVIAEPPAVARGLSFRLRDGDEVQLFIKRGELPLTFEGGDQLERYKALKVIGTRRVAGGKVHCVGDVLWHFGCPPGDTGTAR